MLAKVSLLCAFLAVAHANILLAPAHIISTGVSKSSRQQDAHGNYAFGYDIADGKGATNSRSEVGDAAGNRKGSYSLTDADGRARRVDYVADGHGFRAAVKTNEPGTAMSAPAAAVIASPYAAPVAPVAAAPIMAPSAKLVAAPVSIMSPLVAAAAPISSYSTVIGHQVAAPVQVVGHGSILGQRIVSPLGIGLGATLGKSLLY